MGLSMFSRVDCLTCVGLHFNQLLLDAVHHPSCTLSALSFIIGIPILSLAGIAGFDGEESKKSRPQVKRTENMEQNRFRFAWEETEDSLGVVKVRQDWLADAKPTPADFRPDVYR